ncbi:MAG: serine hydrolase [Clostridia bacterium]|nr:serine hydrolase [Clostridia bacterium]
MNSLEKYIEKVFSDKLVSNLAIKVGTGNTALYETYRSDEERIDGHTLFDMASITKILATTTLCLIAADKGLLDFNTSVTKFFGKNSDKQSMTVFHLLTHTTGVSPKGLNIPGINNDNISDYILNIPYEIPLGSEVMYNCQGFILLGKILEKVFNERLDILFRNFVCDPLGMKKTTFCPCDKINIVNSNLSESEIGVVNDPNSRHLGGVAGNAGIFSNVSDLTKYIQMLIKEGQPIISKTAFNQAVKNHTSHLSESRGLGFLYVDDRYKQTGGLFSDGSFGHCGHTGQSFFVDPKSGLYVIILSDATISTVKKYGKENYEEVVKMRSDIHNAIKCDLQKI